MSLKVHSFVDSYFITRVERHLEFKECLLTMLENTPCDVHQNETENISKSDWKYIDTPREYADMFVGMIYLHMEELARELKAEKWHINELWFQQYQHNDMHGWHNHGQCMYTNVYFLELPDSKDATQFFDPINKRIMPIEKLEEGTMITIPSHVLHRSPPLGKGRKTVIAFNSDIYDYDNNYIRSITDDIPRV